jgi:DNA-binding IclR family transcriptional regulator
LERGLSVLELLGAAEGGLPVSEVAQRLKLPMGTTHRLLQTLMRAGYVEQDPQTRRYELGLKVLELRGATGGAMRIAAEARPFLRDLMLRTGLRAHLAMYRGGGVVYIDRVDNSASLNQFVPLGRRAHAHATGLGKALLAHASEEEVAAYLARHELKKFTSTTLTDAAALREELRDIRQRGFAIDRGESQPDTRCIAAPIFDYTGRAIAAVSVAGTPEEVEPRISDLARAVLDLSRDISRRFGYRDSSQPEFSELDAALTWGGQASAKVRSAAGE